DHWAARADLPRRTLRPSPVSPLANWMVRSTPGAESRSVRVRSHWAALNVVEQHGGRIEAVGTLEADVSRPCSQRSRQGLWYSTRDISPDPIRRLFGFVQLVRVAG